MLKILEGLNGAGKSTVIKRWSDKGIGMSIQIPLSDFSNNRKWTFNEDCHKFSKIKSDKSKVSTYIFGVYETALYAAIDQIQRFPDKDVYMDRSFLTAYVYGSIDFPTCTELMKLYQRELGVYLQFVLLNTDIDICIERRLCSTDKGYATLDPEKQKALYEDLHKNLFHFRVWYGVDYIVTKDGEQ